MSRIGINRISANLVTNIRIAIREKIVRRDRRRWLGFLPERGDIGRIFR